MLRKKELEWYYQEGASNIYPDRWEGYRDAIDPLKRGNFMKAYVERMGGKDGKAIGRRWRGDGEEMRRRRRHLVEKRQRSRASKRE